MRYASSRGKLGCAGTIGAHELAEKVLLERLWIAFHGSSAILAPFGITFESGDICTQTRRHLFLAQGARDQAGIDKEAALDGIYVIRTSVAARGFDAERVVSSYKQLAHVERAFRSLKTVDLKIRPIFHYSADRVRAHVFLCMLAYYVEWHMREALAPVLFDEDDYEGAARERKSIVAPAKPSPSAANKASTKRTADGTPVHSFRTLLLDLATIAKNTVVAPAGDDTRSFTVITSPTDTQQRALSLLGVGLNL